MEGRREPFEKCIQDRMTGAKCACESGRSRRLVFLEQRAKGRKLRGGEQPAHGRDLRSRVDLEGEPRECTAWTLNAQSWKG